MFFKKYKFKIYTNDNTIKRSILYINKHEYYFNEDGFIEIELKPKTYEFKICNQTLVFDFLNPDSKILIYREDNDCHFNVLVKYLD